MNLTYDQLIILFWILLALTIAAAVVTIYLFLHFNVIRIISDLSGRNQRKEVERLQNEQAESIELSSQELKMRKKLNKGKTTGTLDKSTSQRLASRAMKQGKKAQVLDSNVHEELEKVQDGVASSDELFKALEEAESEQLSKSSKLSNNNNIDLGARKIENDESSTNRMSDSNRNISKDNINESNKSKNQDTVANTSTSGNSANTLESDLSNKQEPELNRKNEIISHKENEDKYQNSDNSDPSNASDGGSAETALLTEDQLPDHFKNIDTFNLQNSKDDIDLDNDILVNEFESDLDDSSSETSLLTPDMRNNLNIYNQGFNQDSNHQTTTNKMMHDTSNSQEDTNQNSNISWQNNMTSNNNNFNNQQYTNNVYGETAKLDMSNNISNMNVEAEESNSDWFSIEKQVKLGSQEEAID